MSNISPFSFLFFSFVGFVFVFVARYYDKAEWQTVMAFAKLAT